MPPPANSETKLRLVTDASSVDPEAIDEPEWRAISANRSRLDERVGVLAAQIHMLQAELVETISEFDAVGGWQDPSLKSLSQWISIRTKFSTPEAKRLATVVNRLDSIPTLLGAAKEGRVSIGCLQLATRVSNPDNEKRVAKIVLDCTPAQASRVLSKYRDIAPEEARGQHSGDNSGDNNGAADDGSDGTTDDGSTDDNSADDNSSSGQQPADDDPGSPSGPGPSNESGTSGGPGPSPEPEPAYWWRSWHDESGRARIDAALDQVTFALLEQARDAARAAGEREGRSAEDQDDPSVIDDKAERLGPNEIVERLASTMLDAAHSDGVRAPDGEKFLVQLNIDVETLAQILGIDFSSKLPFRLGSECFLPATGAHLSNTQAAEILCDSSVQVLVHHDGVPLWLGNEHRNFTRQQKRAMRFRSGGGGGCEFPGCEQTRFVHAHHAKFHTDDGVTALDNGVLLCGYHHRSLHRRGWRVTTDGDQRFTFWDGNRCLGTTNRAHASGGRPPDLQTLPNLDGPPDPVSGIDGETPKSTSRGERMTYYAFDVYVSSLLTA